MLDRRRFLGTGLSALVVGLAGAGLGRPARAAAPEALLRPRRHTRPILRLDPRFSGSSITVGGYRFANHFDGDWPETTPHPPVVPIDEIPAPSEAAELVIVGGGLSGLASAYMLRDFRPIVLERLARFGGASQGEHWIDTTYSLGGAYFIYPDEGSSLEALYLDLGLDRTVRIDESAGPAELNAQVIEDFFNWAGIPPQDRPAFDAYRALVLKYVDLYPDIPLPKGKDNQWILDLDRISLKAHVESVIGGPAPDLLAAAVQSYCYSSFGAGWEELSAAAGWNFIAAEEYGRWVLPGGNSGLADALWERLGRGHGAASRLRASCNVRDVRLAEGGGALVAYDDDAGVRRSILADKVIMACPKYVAKQIIHDLPDLDLGKVDAIDRLVYRPYVVANVLVNARMRRDFYDLFLLGNGVYPSDTAGAEEFSRATDVVNGHFARRGHSPRSVLTLYWPLPWDTARFTLTPNVAPLETYAAGLAARLDEVLPLLQLPKRAVEQVRLVRWGHALPIAAPGILAEGVADALRRPIADTIYFVEQDNWALPAVETCLLEAESMASLITERMARSR